MGFDPEKSMVSDGGDKVDDSVRNAIMETLLTAEQEAAAKRAVNVIPQHQPPQQVIPGTGHVINPAPKPALSESLAQLKARQEKKKEVRKISESETTDIKKAIKGSLGNMTGVMNSIIK